MKTTVTIDDDVYWSFQEEIARRRVSQKEGFENAVAEYASGMTRGLNADQVRDLGILAEIMNSHDETDKLARQSLINAIANWRLKYGDKEETARKSTDSRRRKRA